MSLSSKSLKNFKRLNVLGILLFAWPAWSDSPSQVSAISTSGPASVQWVAGKPATVTWMSTGDVAAVMRFDRYLKDQKAKFVVSENLCNNVTGVACAINYDAHVITMSLEWTKNAKPALLGENPGLLYGYFFFFGFHPNLFPKLEAGLRTPTLTCDDYSWLPGGTKGVPPTEATIQHYEGETNAPNPETGITKVRSIGGIYNMRFRRNSSGQLEIVHEGRMEGNMDLFPLVSNFVPSSSLYLASPSPGQVCQVSIAYSTPPNPQSIFDIPSTGNKPYLVNADELDTAVGYDDLRTAKDKIMSLTPIDV